jgi:hypothetical protein
VSDGLCLCIFEVGRKILRYKQVWHFSHERQTRVLIGWKDDSLQLRQLILLSLLYQAV